MYFYDPVYKPFFLFLLGSLWNENNTIYLSSLIGLRIWFRLNEYSMNSYMSCVLKMFTKQRKDQLWIYIIYLLISFT